MKREALIKVDSYRDKNREEPPWKDFIDRWYQIDENGYAFCQALYEWKQQNKLPKFDALVLNLPEGSNLSDVNFVMAAPASPAKFVYTLPNIAGTLVVQMLKFQGPLFCFSESAGNTKILSFAQNLLKAGHRNVFVIESSLALNDNEERVVKGYIYSRE